MLLDIRNAVRTDIGYTAVHVNYGMTFQLTGEFVDPSSSSMNMDISPTRSGLQMLCALFNLFQLERSQLIFSFNPLCHLIHNGL